MKRIPAILLGMLVLAGAKATAQGDLLLFPRRLIFDGSQKAQSLNLANSGRDTVKYQISVVQIRMNREGAFETITQPDSGQHFADKYFRFFPRSVTLAPNEAQTVKVQLINTADLQPGEYRSHLYFRSEPDKKPLGEEKQDKPASGISVDLRAVFGISIPVIIRSGPPDVGITLTDAAVNKGPETASTLNVTFHRLGNQSAYGDVVVDHIAATGRTTRVATVKGMAVYAPNTERHISLPLASLPGVNYLQGKLHITYTTQSDVKAERIAETELVLH